MQNTRILKKNRNIVTRKIDNETILMPIYRTSEEINCIYTLNQSAARVWELVDGKRSLGKIKQALLKEFDVSEKEVDRELCKLLKDLEEIKAVQ